MNASWYDVIILSFKIDGVKIEYMYYRNQFERKRIRDWSLFGAAFTETGVVLRGFGITEADFSRILYSGEV